MKRIMSAALMMTLSTTAFAEEWTATKLISNVAFDARADHTIYFETASGNWSAAGCPNARYVMVRNSTGLKEILSLGLGAKLAERNVRFYGNCHNADYFQAEYVLVE